MADFGDHRICTVRSALPETARMNMHVRDNDTPGLPTMCPEIAKLATVNNDNAGPQRVRIDVVIEDELFDPPRLAGTAQQEGTALLPTASTPPQFGDPRPPDL